MSHNTLHTDQTGTTILPDPRRETLPRRIGAFFAQPVVIVWIIFVLMFPLSRIVSSNFPSFGQLESTLILGLFLVVVAFGVGLASWLLARRARQRSADLAAAARAG